MYFVKSKHLFCFLQKSCHDKLIPSYTLSWMLPKMSVSCIHLLFPNNHNLEGNWMKTWKQSPISNKIKEILLNTIFKHYDKKYYLCKYTICWPKITCSKIILRDHILITGIVTFSPTLWFQSIFLLFSIHQMGCTPAPGCHIKCSICSHSLMSTPFTNISTLLFLLKLYPFYYRYQGFFILPFITFFPSHYNFQSFVSFSYALNIWVRIPKCCFSHIPLCF